VTFLLTDVESSTALWDRDAGAMSRALQLHDTTIERAVTDAGGRVLKERGEGDSTFSVFTRPTEAVRASLAARRALEAADWPPGFRLEVRFAIHMGEVEERDGDYYGTAVNRAARIRGLAVGGQILVSQAVSEVVVDHLPDGASLAELGEQELRGMTRPERICAVVDAARPVREAIGGLCPYKGLLAFQPEDDDIFFGREAKSAELLGRLLDRGLLVIVVGASGSGKSSLVRAGVLASIRRGEVPGSGSWSIEIITPGENPAARLATALASDGAAPRVVIAVDQMEELFTSCRDAGEREEFVDTLLDAIESGDGKVMAIGALRADFYGHCATIPRLATALSDANVLLGPMSEEELRRAIEAPAEVAGLQLEPGLVDIILRDLAREPGSLPLLSHALLETWQRRTGRTMTLAGYHDSGGVRGAIAQTAEAVWTDALTESQRPVARRIFLRLTELGEGTEDTRRRVSRTELVSGANAEEVDSVLGLLADRRLITVDDDTVEVAHEALIREWPRLRTWLDDDREGLRTHRHLTHAAEDWNALDRDPTELYRGPRLQATRDWLARDATAQLNELEAAFVEASEEQERAERSAEEERIAARERANRRLRILLAAAAIALVIAVVAGVIAFNQRQNADKQADRAQATSVSAEVDRAVAEVPRVLERDRALALLLGVQAQAIRPDAATKGALFEALVDEPRLRATLWGGHGGYAWTEPIPNGTRIVALGREGGDVWDLATRTKIGSFAVPPAGGGLAVSPDGRLIAAGSRAGSVGFWDANTLQPVGEPIDAGAPVIDVVFTRDGDRVAIAVGAVLSEAAATAETTTRLWNVETRQETGVTLDGHTQTVNTLALSPDGTLLAAGDNGGRVVFHDPATGAAVGAPLELGADEGILQVAFSRDGRRLAIGTFGRGGFGHGHVADVANRTEVAQLGEGSLVNVGFNADGSQLVTTAETTDVWNIETRQPVGDPIRTQHGPGAVIAYDRDDLWLAGLDGTLTLWEPGGLPTIARVLEGAPQFGGTFSPDGTLLAITDDQDAVTLYRVHGFERIGTFSVGGEGPREGLEGPTPLAFSADSRVFAVGDRVGNVQLFDTASREKIGTPIRVNDGSLTSLAFHPDGRTLAATSNLDTVNGAHIVDVESRRVAPVEPAMPYALSATFRPDGKELVFTVGVGGALRFSITDGVVGRGSSLDVPGALPETGAYSPDGKLLAIGRTDGTLSFLDATTFEQIDSSVPVSSGLLATATWSSDGSLVAVQDVDANQYLVNVAQRARIGEPIPGVGPAQYGLAGFAPDGRAMVLPGREGTVLMNLDDTTWPAQACPLAGRNLTPAEWERYFSASGEYRRTCPGIDGG
jgi:class 3 adenylate cyclase/WD40 repeat protein